MKKLEILDAIKTALDCHSHFSQPTVIEHDSIFTYGKRAMLVCDECVEKLEKILDATKTTHYKFPEIRVEMRYDRKRKKRNANK